MHQTEKKFKWSFLNFLADANSWDQNGKDYSTAGCKIQ